MLKKIAAVVLISALLLGNWGLVPVTATDNAVSLSLEEAVEFALEHSPQAGLDEIGIKKAEVNLSEARSAADKLEEGTVTSYDLAVVKYVLPKQAKSGLLLARKGAEYREKALKIEVEKLYYDMLLAREELRNAESVLERSQEQLRLVRAGRKAGTAANIDVIRAEAALAAAEAEVSGRANALEIKRMEFNKKLGLDLETEINLTSGFNFEELEIDLEKEVDRALEEDFYLLQAKEGLAVAEEAFKQVKKYYTPNVYKYREVEYELEEAGIKVAEQRSETEFNVRRSFLNLQTAGRNYVVIKANVKAAREALRLAQLKYSAGMGTYLEMRKAADELQNMEARMSEGLYSYNLAKSQFKYGIYEAGPSGFGS